MLIPLREITAEAKTMFKDATDHDRLVFQQWAATALKRLGPTKDNIDVCVLYPHDFRMKKPNNFSSAIDIALFSGEDVEIKNTYKSGNKRIHTRTNSTLPNPYVEVSEDDYYFNLSSNATDVAYVKLRYFSLSIDDDGYPLIPEIFRLALLMYIKWMWSIRRNDSENEKAQSRQDWLIEAAAAKSRAKMPSMLEAKKIGSEWTTMISKHFKSDF